MFKRVASWNAQSCTYPLRITELKNCKNYIVADIAAWLPRLKSRADPHRSAQIRNMGRRKIRTDPCESARLRIDGGLIQWSNEKKASYRFEGELLHYTAAIEVDSNESARLVLHEVKFNIADLPRQPSGSCLVPTGCPVDGADSHECEAVSLVTSEAREKADSDASWQTPS